MSGLSVTEYRLLYIRSVCYSTASSMSGLSVTEYRSSMSGLCLSTSSSVSGLSVTAYRFLYVRSVCVLYLFLYVRSVSFVYKVIRSVNTP